MAVLGFTNFFVNYITYNLLISLLITVIAIFVVNFYRQRRKYPPGPFPLPLIGNVQFSIETCQTLNFAAKKWTNIRRIILGDSGANVVLSDVGPEWSALRKLMHNALRQHTPSIKLSTLTSDAVDESLKDVKVGEVFCPFEMTQLIVFNIMSDSAFSIRWTKSDWQFESARKLQNKISRNLITIAITDLLPWTRLFLNWRHLDLVRECKKRSLVVHEFNKHLETYNSDRCRNFCDALIQARSEAIENDPKVAPFLTDQNLSYVILDIVIAGVDTTRVTLNWLILFLANNTEVQKKVRAEVSSVVGSDKSAVIEDKSRCHYTQAFIAEVMRYRPAVPIHLGHQAALDARCGDFTIPKGTPVNYVQDAYLKSEKYFENAHEFRPEKFLNSQGEFKGRVEGFVPFGVGRRACVGDNFAMANIFYTLVRLMQKTEGKMIELENGIDSVSIDGDISERYLYTPDKYKLVIRNCEEG